MANLAFQRQILYLHKIIKEKSWLLTGTVTIEGSVYSMDSPAVRAKVRYTDRLIQVKMKMSGFIELYQLRTRRSIYLQCLKGKSR
jgi:hypothetical protein